MDDETTRIEGTGDDERTSVLDDWGTTQVEEDEPRNGTHPLPH